MEERLCPSVQTELHVLESGPLTDDIRAQYAFTAWRQLMDMRDQFVVPKVVYAIMSRFA